MKIVRPERRVYEVNFTPSASPSPNCCVYFGWNEVELPRCGFYGNVEMDCVHNAAALELHPDAICAHTRECEIELNLRRAIGDERMRMHHIDQIVAYGEHVAPGSQILFQPVARRNFKTHRCVPSCNRWA